MDGLRTNPIGRSGIPAPPRPPLTDSVQCPRVALLSRPRVLHCDADSSGLGYLWKKFIGALLAASVDKLDLLAFDACLMAHYSVMVAINGVTKYFGCIPFEKTRPIASRGRKKPTAENVIHHFFTI